MHHQLPSLASISLITRKHNNYFHQGNNKKFLES